MKYISNDNFAIETIAGESVIVPVSDNVKTLNSLFTLNEVAEFILTRLQAGMSIAEIVADITICYEIDEASATKDIIEFANLLVERGFFRKES